MPEHEPAPPPVAVTRAYHVDLSLSPGRRWAPMLRDEGAHARTLIGQVIADGHAIARRVPLGRMLFAGMRRAVTRISLMCRARYPRLYDDFAVWSREADLEPHDLIFANLVYEFSAACTAVAFDLEDGKGVAHVRNMDWPMVGIGPRSCVIHYHGPQGPFTTLGWPGYVGVLSGVAPGRFSATINQAPKRRYLPHIAWPASYALRHAFEECTTWAEAVDGLAARTLCAPAFYLVAGVRPGEATVIEHMNGTVRRRDMRDGWLAVSNHYQHPDLQRFNRHRITSAPASDARGLCAARLARAARGAGSDPHALMHALDARPALHALTAQQMAFIPRSGAYACAYRDTDAAARAFWHDLGLTAR